MPTQPVIVIAEDDDAVRSVLVRSLAREGFAIVETFDGAEALRAFEVQPDAPDLLLTDVAMPGLSGPDLAAVVTARWPGTRVAFITAYAGEHAVKMVTSGHPVLPKPFTHDELVRFVRKALAQPAPAASRH
jgi:CheY-like chemotaxis protein